MGNRVALLVVAVFATASMGAGALVGAELGGAGSGASPAAGATTTPGAAAGGEIAGATDSPTPTPTATPRPTVAAAAFDRTEIERQVVAAVNAERRSRGVGTLGRSAEVREMARFHSERMAEQRYVSHVAGGFTNEKRHEKFGLAGRCRVANDANAAMLDGRELEAVERTVAGRPYASDGERRIDRDESAVAEAVVDAWLDDDGAREKLLLSNAEAVGVGVTVADDGAVYVTLNLC